MSKSTTSIEQQYLRLQKIFNTARQRYLEAGGDPSKSGGSLLNQQDFLTDQEKQEIIHLGRQVFNRPPRDSAVSQ